MPSRSERRRTRLAYLRFQRWKERLRAAEVAWYPWQPVPDPAGGDEIVFFRPRDVLVDERHAERLRAYLARLLDDVTVSEPSVITERIRLLRFSTAPAAFPELPLLIRRLRARPEFREATIGLNHVMFPAGDKLTGTPWESGGGEGGPTAAAPSRVVFPGRGTGWDGPTTGVLVLDSGVIAGRAVAPWLVDATEYTPSDVIFYGKAVLFDRHSEFVAGVIRCVAPQAAVTIHRVLDDFGIVDDSQLATEMLRILPDPRFGVVNLSLGCLTDQNRPPAATEDALRTLTQKGVLIVAAAGNNSTDRPFFPAALPAANVIAVGALAAGKGTPAGFSNAGPWVDVWAPGEKVVNAFENGVFLVDGGLRVITTGVAQWSGTSFAAPYVAGLLTRYVADPALAAIAPTAWLAQFFPHQYDGKPALDTAPPP